MIRRRLEKLCFPIVPLWSVVPLWLGALLFSLAFVGLLVVCFGAGRLLGWMLEDLKHGA